MNFDTEGRVTWTPKALYDKVLENPRRLVTGYLMAGTPVVFESHARYCEFIEAVAERTGVHPKNLYLRGSCHIGFSITPRNDKVWTAKSDVSDLDLVIVDGAYYKRFDREVRRWDERNPVEYMPEPASRAWLDRKRDRRFNCCRDTDLPAVVCVHHQETMARLAALALAGPDRDVSAFLYPDWHSAWRRYEDDLRRLRKGVEAGELTPPGDDPLPPQPKKRKRPPQTESLAVATAAAVATPVRITPERSRKDSPRTQSGTDVVKQGCPKCGNALEQVEFGWQVGCRKCDSQMFSS